MTGLFRETPATKKQSLALAESRAFARYDANNKQDASGVYSIQD